MKKHLLLTTALVAISGIIFPAKADIIINSGDNITNSDLSFEGSMDEDNYRPIVTYQNLLQVNGGNLDVKLVHMDIGRVEIKSGNVKLDDAYITTHDGEFFITGGNMTINNHGGFGSGSMDVSGNSIINLNNSLIEVDSGFSSKDATINLTNGAHIAVEAEDSNNNSSEFVINSGTINMSGNNNFLLHGYEVDDKFTSKQANLNGGIFNVNSGNNYLFFDNTDLGGTINVAQKSSLGTYSGFTTNGHTETIADVQLGDKGMINVTQSGTINLGGTLNSNVNNTGKMNITSTSAKLNGNLNVNNNGVVDLGTNKLTVYGDVAFNSGSTLQTTLTNKNSFGSLKANTIKISDDNTTLKMAFNGGVVAKDETIKLKILDTNTLDGTFSNQPENARYDIKYLGNGVYEITGLEDTGDIIDDGGNSGDQQTENMKSAGEAWDSLVTDENSSQTTVAVAEKLAELSNSTSTEDKKAYKDALVALAPETAPAVEASQMQISNQVFNAVGTRMSGGSYSGYQRGMSSGDGYSDTAIWVQGMLNKAKYDKSKETEFDSDTWGTAIGLEKQFNYATKFGLGYAYSKSDIDGFNRKTDVNTHTALVYGEVKPNNWFANVIASYGWSDYEEKKNVAGVNVKADYDVETFGLQAMTGYDIYSRATGVTLTPEAGVRYLHIKNKEYTDSAGQKTKNEDSDVLTGVLGVGLSKNYRIIYTNIRVKPEARVAMTYDFQQDDTKSTVTLPNNAVYSVTGKPLNRYGVEIGAGFTADFYDTMELSLGYEGKFREDYQDHTGLVNAKVKF